MRTEFSLEENIVQRARSRVLEYTGLDLLTISLKITSDESDLQTKVDYMLELISALTTTIGKMDQESGES